MVQLTKNGKSDHRAGIHLITLIHFCKNGKAKRKFGRRSEGKVDKTRPKVERSSNIYANVRHVVVRENSILHSNTVAFKPHLSAAGDAFFREEEDIACLLKRAHARAACWRHLNWWHKPQLWCTKIITLHAQIFPQVWVLVPQQRRDSVELTNKEEELRFLSLAALYGQLKSKTIMENC